MTCWKCGEEMLEGDNYCPRCGSECVERLYEHCKNYQLTPIHDIHGQGLEFYHESAWNYPFPIYGGVNLSAQFYNGKLYYLNRKNLCLSRDDGTERQILAENILEEESRNVFDRYALLVNCVGVFVYYAVDTNADSYTFSENSTEANKQFVVLKFLDHSGKLKQEYHLPVSGVTSRSHLAIYDEKVYYYTWDRQTDRICCMNVLTGQDEVICECTANELFASSNMLVFTGEPSGCLSATGLYQFDLFSKRLSKMDAFDNYNNYFLFDMIRGIYWKKVTGVNDQHTYLVPYQLTNHELLPNAPVWKLHDDFKCYTMSYFNGIVLFSTYDEETFYSYDQYGNRYQWNLGDETYVSNLLVAGDKLYLKQFGNNQGHIVQYPATAEPSEKLCEAWFHEPIEKQTVNSAERAAERLPVWDAKASDELKDCVQVENLCVNLFPEPDTIAENMDNQLTAEKALSETDVKYGIMTFGVKFDVGCGTTVKVICAGSTYLAKMHRTTKGRIDGLKALYREQGLTVGQIVHAVYNAENHIIRID